MSLKKSEFHVAELDLTNVGKIPGLKRRGLMLALSSPSGAGKTTMSRLLLDEDDDIKISISCTTRAPRNGEQDGVHYHFISEDKFQSMVESGEFLEHAEVFGNYYGTPRAPVEKALNSGVDVMFDIDWQGKRQLRESAPKDLVSVFILPPSWVELHNRLIKRAQDTNETITRRMGEANEEISHYDEYDYVIINRQIDDSMYKLRTILGSERMKRERLSGLPEFVEVIRKEGIHEFKKLSSDQKNQG